MKQQAYQPGELRVEINGYASQLLNYRRNQFLTGR